MSNDEEDISKFMSDDGEVENLVSFEEYYEQSYFDPLRDLIFKGMFNNNLQGAKEIIESITKTVTQNFTPEKNEFVIPGEYPICIRTDLSFSDQTRYFVFEMYKSLRTGFSQLSANRLSHINACQTKKIKGQKLNYKNLKNTILINFCNFIVNKNNIIERKDYEHLGTIYNIDLHWFREESKEKNSRMWRDFLKSYSKLENWLDLIANSRHFKTNEDMSDALLKAASNIEKENLVLHKGRVYEIYNNELLLQKEEQKSEKYRDELRSYMIEIENLRRENKKMKEELNEVKKNRDGNGKKRSGRSRSKNKSSK
jgi:hypothetical protein